jgi:hypothetical protein
MLINMQRFFIIFHFFLRVVDSFCDLEGYVTAFVVRQFSPDPVAYFYRFADIYCHKGETIEEIFLFLLTYEFDSSLNGVNKLSGYQTNKTFQSNGKSTCFYQHCSCKMRILSLRSDCIKGCLVLC